MRHKKKEAGQYNGQDLPFLNAITKGKAGKSRLHAIVSGHDHGNDWCAPSNVTTAAAQVLPLCFGKHSGFGGYDYDPWNHGARIFEFDLDSVDKSVRTYIRMLTGETVSRTSALPCMIPCSVFRCLDTLQDIKVPS